MGTAQREREETNGVGAWHRGVRRGLSHANTGGMALAGGASAGASGPGHGRALARSNA